MILQSDSLFTSKHNLHYFDSGAPESGKEVILIFHGLFGGLSNFDTVINSFRKNYRILLPIFPIFDEPNFQDFTKIIQSTHQFITDLEINTPVHLIGNSLGGQLSILFQQEFPELVKSLVLSGSAGLGEQSFGYSKPKRHSRSYVEKRTEEVFFSYKLSSNYIDEIMDILKNSTKLIRLLRIAKMSKNSRLDHILPNITSPVLLIWGKNDIITPPETALAFNELLPNSELHWIDKCGHAAMTEHPVLFHKFCSNFYNSITLKTEKEQLYVSSNYTFR